MAAKKKQTSGLGKGLEEIFGSGIGDVLEDIQQGKSEERVSGKYEIDVKEIKPNPYQPRKQFDETKLQELAESIKLHGVFTPILVKKSVKGYELVAGERRLRASKLAKLKKIPAIIVEFDDTQMMEIALLENIQREDLSVIEEAQGYEKLIKKLGYTQEELANRVGKSREHITNTLRLLKLPKKVQVFVENKELSMGHVRALLPLQEESLILDVAKEAKQKQMSVRAVEKLVKDILQPKDEKKKNPQEAEYKALEDMLQSKLQTRVIVDPKQLVIKYNGVQDLNRILEIINCLEED